MAPVSYWALTRTKGKPQSLQDSKRAFGSWPACTTDPGFRLNLTELRALDTELTNPYFDYLSCDRLGRREVHRHLCGSAEGLSAAHHHATTDAQGAGRARLEQPLQFLWPDR